MTSKLCGVFLVGLLCGCARGPDVVTEIPVAEPDCSFRAATSCWTLSVRLPSTRAEPADSTDRELVAPPPVLVANAVDSVSGREP
jgi:hypothetical protein